MKNKQKIIIASILTIFFHFFIYCYTPIEYFDYKTYDVLKNITKKITTKKHNSSVVIIDIDEKSLKEFGQWPWSRLLMTQLVRKIQENHPSSLGIDVIFSEYDRTSPNNIINFYNKYLSKNVNIEGLSTTLLNNDKIFANQLSKSKVVLPVYLDSKVNENCEIKIDNLNIINSSNINIKANSILCNIKEIQKNSYNNGFINSSSDRDGIFRRLALFIKYKDRIIPSFSLANLMNVDEVKVNKDSVSVLNHKFIMNKDSSVLLNFYGESSFKKISVYDILTDNFDTTSLSGKFVLIGSSAIGLNDHYKLSGDVDITGVEIHATLIDNILNDSLIYEIDVFSIINVILSIIVSFFIIYFLIKENIKNLFILLIPILIVFILNLYFLSKGIYLFYGYFLLPFISQLIILSIILIFVYIKNKQNFYKDLIKAHTSTIDNMAIVIENRDLETGAHIKRVKEYCKCMATYLYKNEIYKKIVDEEFIELIYKTSSLHDIGKIGIPDIILQKPGKLTPEEFEIMKKHPEIGKKIIENSLKEHKDNSLLKMAYNIAYYHHEKWDGTGYPNEFKAHKIPLEARIIAIVDVYDALVSKRYYKKAYDYEYSENIILQNRGLHFDPLLVDAFKYLKNDFKNIAEKYKDT